MKHYVPVLALHRQDTILDSSVEAKPSRFRRGRGVMCLGDRSMQWKVNCIGHENE